MRFEEFRRSFIIFVNIISEWGFVNLLLSASLALSRIVVDHRPDRSLTTTDNQNYKMLNKRVRHSLLKTCFVDRVLGLLR